MESTLNPLIENDLLCCEHQDYEISQPEPFQPQNNIASLLLLSPNSFNIQYNFPSPHSQSNLSDSQNSSNSINTDLPCSCLSIEQQSPPAYSEQLQLLPYYSPAKQNYNQVHRWNKQECLSYDRFIQLYLDVILERGPESNSNSNSTKIQIKKNKNLFQMMSKFVGTRDVTQCRSHHQKFFSKALAKLGINQQQYEFYPLGKKNLNEPEKKVKTKGKLSILSSEIEEPVVTPQPINPFIEKIYKSK